MEKVELYHNKVSEAISVMKEVAESKPEEKEIMVSLVMNFLTL